MDSPAVWIILGIILLALLIGLVWYLVGQSKQKQLERDRAEATEIRQQAADQEMLVRERQAAAAQTDAEARAARAEAERQAAEADQRNAEAERLEVQAQRRTDEYDQVSAQHDEQLRRADALDPDVRTDEHGNRLDDHRADRSHRDEDLDGDGYRDRTIESEDSYAESDTYPDGRESTYRESETYRDTDGPRHAEGYREDEVRPLESDADRGHDDIRPLDHDRGDLHRDVDADGRPLDADGRPLDDGRGGSHRA